jgi:hypothetical protein
MVFAEIAAPRGDPHRGIRDHHRLLFVLIVAVKKLMGNFTATKKEAGGAGCVGVISRDGGNIKNLRSI